LEVDVLVVGGGVSGSTVSSLLARVGIKVMMVDRKAKPGHPHHCSGILGPEAIRELIHFSEDWVLSEINWARFISPGGICLEIRKPLAKVVDRSMMDKELWEYSLSLGAIGKTSTQFKGLLSMNEALVGDMSVRFKFLIGADGVLSSVAEAFGLPRQEYEIGLQRVVRGCVRDGYIVRIVKGSQFCWIQPWGSLSKAGAIGRIGDPVLKWTYLLTREESRSYEGGLIPFRPRKEFFRDNIALVGDAAGQIKPISRGGVLFSVRGAKILSKALIDSLQYEKNELPRYQRSWWDIHKKEISFGMALRQWLDKANHKKIDKMFRLIKEYEHEVEKAFSVDRQSETARSLPIIKILKLATVDIEAALQAISKLLKYMVR